MLYDALIGDHWLLEMCFCDYIKGGVNLPKAAAFFNTSERTVYRWWKESKMPYLARKLCWLKQSGCMSLHGKEWDGFHITKEGKLQTPFPDYALTPNELAATWYLVRNNFEEKPHEWWYSIKTGELYDAV